MSEPRKTAIFAESEGARHFLSEMLHLIGHEATDGASLRQQGNQLVVSPGGMSTADLSFMLPQRAAVLMTAICSAMEKQKGGKKDVVFGPYVLDTYNHLLSEEGAQTRLTEKESAILLCLHKAGGAIVGRQSLLDEVWGYAQNVETHTLETHIYRLRQKIEKDPSNPKFLKTEEEGYSLAL